MESEIASFYRDRSVFVTGGTGFFGKILIEKLLRCCPGLKCIYVLIRTKAGQDAKSRLQDLLASRAFDNVRQNHPEFFKKVVPVSGDISREELGISPQDLEMMSRTVSIVFHSAATVRFDEPIKNAVELNIKGVKRLLSVCKKMGNLEVLVHVSTAYVNSHRSELNETIYRPLCDPDKLVVTLDWLDDLTANTITKSLLHGSPNTYTFTKSLGETIISSEASEFHFKVAIVRPSIVTASWKEPLPGWVDTINGPTGLFAGSAAGIFRTMYCHTQMAVDIIPGEFPVNLMIASAWDTLANTISKQPMNPTVYLASTGQNPVTWAQCEKIIYPLMFEYPFSRAVWPPGGSFKSNYFHHKLDQALFHFAPAYVLDMLIRLCGKKPFMVRLHKKAAKAMNCLQFYTIREWRSRCDNTNGLVDRMSLTDRAMFNVDTRTIDWEDYLCTYYLGVRKFILKDEPHTLPAAKSHMRNLLLIQFGFRLTLVVLLARTIIRRSETARSLWQICLSTAGKYFLAATQKLF